MSKIFGHITQLLAKKYIDLGFTLTEDEDFLYLSRTGQKIPWVYSSHGASIERIHKEIEQFLTAEK